MNERENYLRAIRMCEPEWIPCRVAFPMATWNKYRERLEDLVLRYRNIFPFFKRRDVIFDDFGLQRKNIPVRDEWGCVWNFLVNGLDGQVVEHPLDDWNAFDTFRPPYTEADKDGLYCSYPSNWGVIRKNVKKDVVKGRIILGNVPHGFMFMRLYYLRGFKNLMLDFASEHPKLQDLINIVLEYNLKMIRKWLEIGVDVMNLGDDLGMQDRMPISPKSFIKYLSPAYKEILKLVHEYEAYAYLHTDGHIIEIANELVAMGVDIINPQIRANGLEGIREAFKDKVCIDLDVDRQYILPFGNPEDIKNHIKHVVLQLGSKQGGLWVIAGCYPDVPLSNIEVLCQAMEDYQYFYSK